jgi:hypothetical protein
MVKSNGTGSKSAFSLVFIAVLGTVYFQVLEEWWTSAFCNSDLLLGAAQSSIQVFIRLTKSEPFFANNKFQESDN